MSTRKTLILFFVILFFFAMAQLIYLHNKNQGLFTARASLPLYYLAKPPDTKFWGRLPRAKNGIIETGTVIELDKYKDVRQGILSIIVDGPIYKKDGRLYVPLATSKGNKKIKFRLNLSGKVGVFLVKKGLWGNEMTFKPDYLQNLTSYLQKGGQIVIHLLGTGGNLSEVCKYSKNDCDVLKELQQKYSESNDKIFEEGIKNESEVGYITNIIIGIP